MSRFAVLVLVLASAIAVVSCGGDDDDDDDGGDTTGAVSVVLDEFSLSLTEDSVPAGETTFSVTNEGAEVHEFVILRTDLDPGDLPTAEDGSVDEEGEGIEVVDEIEDIEASAGGELTADLSAGNYALICNVVEEEENGELESHYQEGMLTGFTVN